VNWLVNEKRIAPHILVIAKSKREGRHRAALPLGQPSSLGTLGVT
jgi:hypothetical protein